jgi:hypothetical protein
MRTRKWPTQGRCVQAPGLLRKGAWGGVGGQLLGHGWAGGAQDRAEALGAQGASEIAWLQACGRPQACAGQAAPAKQCSRPWVERKRSLGLSCRGTLSPTACAGEAQAQAALRRVRRMALHPWRHCHRRGVAIGGARAVKAGCRRAYRHRRHWGRGCALCVPAVPLRSLAARWGGLGPHAPATAGPQDNLTSPHVDQGNFPVAAALCLGNWDTGGRLLVHKDAATCCNCRPGHP